MTEKTILMRGNVEEEGDIWKVKNGTLLSITKMLNDMIEKASSLHDHRIDSLTVYWCCVFINRWCDKQPRNFDDIDKYLIEQLRKLNYSIGDIVLIIDRSKSSIHEYLSKL